MRPFPPSRVAPRGRRGSAALQPPSPRAAIYWIDLLVSVAVGSVSFGLATGARGGSWAGAGLTLLSILAWLRALVFLHEITHRGREVPGFELVWSVLVGLPMGIPSLMYVGSHASHHRADRYGTTLDPEYAELARWSATRRVLFVAASALAPLLLVARWGVLTPLSLGIPPLRRWVVSRTSTLSINPGYRRAPPEPGDRTRWLAGETAACALVWGVGTGTTAGLVAPALVAHWLLVLSGVFVVNQARTVLAHRYAGEGDPFDERGQLLDSRTLPVRSWLAALIAPVGLRYHALHHWAPGIPYHDLGRVHRRLVAGAGVRDAYLETLAPSLLAALPAQPGSARGG